MFFIFLARQVSAELSLVTPPDFCCNCGARGELNFVETPLKQVKYFFVFGTELTLTETFPYCNKCVSTATRVRQGWIAKMLATCLVLSAVFLVLVLSASSLPKLLSGNLFYSAAVIAVLLTSVYFAVREMRGEGRTHYQPVRLVDARLHRDQLERFTLKFYNPRYASVIRKANSEFVRSGVMTVVTTE